MCLWNLDFAVQLVDPMQLWLVWMCCIWCTVISSLHVSLCGHGSWLPGLQLHSLVMQSRDWTSSFNLAVWSLWKSSLKLENLECAIETFSHLSPRSSLALVASLWMGFVKAGEWLITKCTPSSLSFCSFTFFFLWVCLFLLLGRGLFGLCPVVDLLHGRWLPFN